MPYSWTCSRCGEAHEGLPLSWAFDAPIYWQSLDEAERETRGFCNPDFCVMTDDAGDTTRFVRGTIEIPIVDADEPEDSLVIGVWSSLSEASLSELVEVQGRGQHAEGGPWFGWLSNRIPVYPDTLNLKTMVHHRQGLRPRIEIHPCEHPLAQDAAGITLERAVDLGERWYHGVERSSRSSYRDDPEPLVEQLEPGPVDEGTSTQ